MKRQIMVFVCAVALLVAGHAQALVIDNFNNVDAPTIDDDTCTTATRQCIHAVPLTPVVVGGVAVPVNSLMPDTDTGLAPGAVGGTRALNLTAIHDTTTVAAGQTSELRVNSGNGELEFTNEPHIKATATIIWDGDGTSTNFGTCVGVGPMSCSGLNGTTGVDLTNGTGSDVGEYLIFRLTNLNIPLLVQVTLKDNDGTTASNLYLKEATTPNGPNPPNFPPVTPLPDPAGIISTNLPGNIYHGLTPFLTGGIDPGTACPASTTTLCDAGATAAGITNHNFWDRIADATGVMTPGAGALAGKPTGGNGVLDLTNIIAIAFTLDTTNPAGSPNLQTSISCFYSAAGPSGPDSEPNGKQWWEDGLGPQNGGVNDPKHSLGINAELPGGACSFPSAVPEPGTALLLGTGLLGVALFGAKLRRRKA